MQTLEEIASDDTPAFLNLSDITSFPAAREQNDNSYMIYSVGNVFLVDDPLPAEDKKDDSSDLYSTPYSRVIAWVVGCLLACLTSQQHASVFQERICSDNSACCHTEIEIADQTIYPT